jgi:hypothetical protein
LDSSEDEAPVFKKNLRDPEDVGGSGTFASYHMGLSWFVQEGGDHHCKISWFIVIFTMNVVYIITIF